MPSIHRPGIMALTLHAPWGWAIAHAGKTIENRNWKPPGWMTGRYLAIHQGKTYDDDAHWTIKLAAPGVTTPEPDECRTGIVAIARLRGYVTEGPRLAEASKRWFVGKYGWVLSDVVALQRPIPCRGAQGLWPLEIALIAELRAQWKASGR